jgi:hypothetical protein
LLRRSHHIGFICDPSPNLKSVEFPHCRVSPAWLAAVGGRNAGQAQADGTSLFKVQVRYNMGGSALMRYGNFIPLPSTTLGATVIVTNGSY